MRTNKSILKSSLLILFFCTLNLDLHAMQAQEATIAKVPPKPDLSMLTTLWRIWLCNEQDECTNNTIVCPYYVLQYSNKLQREMLMAKASQYHLKLSMSEKHFRLLYKYLYTSCSLYGSEYDLENIYTTIANQLREDFFTSASSKDYRSFRAVNDAAQTYQCYHVLKALELITTDLIASLIIKSMENDQQGLDDIDYQISAYEKQRDELLNQ